MRPIRLLTLAAGLVALLATGCGSSGDETSSTPATGTAVAAAPA
jgi:predicted outer membrane protein